MSYLVLARKWRPQTFKDLVGQEHVAQTLRNAIIQGRVAHAFLFTGARGVGKTTIARILARSLNCLTRAEASPDPCLQCAACREIASGTDPDVQEIDGASNNGVDDVRKLQETLPYRPQRDRYKVVIIDEVHMLSAGAWNALLKTLEEPPPHVKFIFATTEVHKVLPTILSRVQRYDFRLIPTAKIRERIAFILEREGFRFDDAAVALIAREAAGSLRDALSLLDQVIAGVEGELTGHAAARLLGVADRKVLYDTARAILCGDAATALRHLDALANEGFDLPNVARGMLSVLRDLVVARVIEAPGELLDLADEERAEVIEIARAHDPVDLERLFVAWARTTEDVARAREPRWVMEMAAVRLAHRPALLPVDALMSRLTELERRLAANAPPTPGTPPSAPRIGGGTAPASPSQGTPSQGTSPSAAPPTTTVSGRFVPPRIPDGVRGETPPPSRAATRAAPAIAEAPPQASWLDRHRARPVPTPTKAPTPPVTAPASPAPTVDTSTATEMLKPWRRVVHAVEGNLVPVLKVAVPLVVSASLVRLAIDERDSFFRKKLTTPEAHDVIAEAASRVFGVRPRVEVLQGILPEGALSIARDEENTRAAERLRREEALRTHPLVRALCEQLHGEITRVRLEGDPS